MYAILTAARCLCRENFEVQSNARSSAVTLGRRRPAASGAAILDRRQIMRRELAAQAPEQARISDLYRIIVTHHFETDLTRHKETYST